MTGTLALHQQAAIALLRQRAALLPEEPAHLYELACALAETGAYDEYAEVFGRAYRAKPSARPLSEFPGHSLTLASATRMRTRAQSLIDRGQIFSSVILALAVSEGLLGNKAELERLVDYGRFFRLRKLRPMLSFADSDFNEILAQEIRTSLIYYKSAPRRAIEKAWRNDDLFGRCQPAISALYAAVRDAVDAYIAELPADLDSPFVRSRPDHYEIKAWAVVSDGKGYHKSHTHPWAWLSGVYYVVQPELSKDATLHRGWLQFSPPPRFGFGAESGWGSRMVAPEPGNLVLVPGYFSHETEPYGEGQERMCVAFDVIPACLLDARESST